MRGRAHLSGGPAPFALSASSRTSAGLVVLSGPGVVHAAACQVVALLGHEWGLEAGSGAELVLVPEEVTHLVIDDVDAY